MISLTKVYWRILIISKMLALTCEHSCVLTRTDSFLSFENVYYNFNCQPPLQAWWLHKKDTANSQVIQKYWILITYVFQATGPRQHFALHHLFASCSSDLNLPW